MPAMTDLFCEYCGGKLLPGQDQEFGQLVGDPFFAYHALCKRLADEGVRTKRAYDPLSGELTTNSRPTGRHAPGPSGQDGSGPADNRDQTG